MRSQYSGAGSSLEGLRDFSGLTEISRHKPHTLPGAHRHFSAYAAIVLHGQYSEVSADGTFEIGPGEVVLHPPLHRHANVFAASQVAVLNLVMPTPAGFSLPYVRLRLAELPCSYDDIVHRPRDSATAIVEALSQAGSLPQSSADSDAIEFAWHTLKQVRAPKLSRVAAEAGISAEHLGRAFRARYGLSPGEYRREHRFHHALRELIAGEGAADTACNSGYSDQPHMTRDFQQRAGTTPMRLLRRLRDCQLSLD